MGASNAERSSIVYFVYFFFLRCRMTQNNSRNGVLREPEVMQKDLGQSDTPSRGHDSTKSATLRFFPTKFYSVF